MDTISYIEDYFNHRLTEEDRKQFEERLKSDEPFAKEVKEHALLINALDETKADKLLLRFNELEDELNKVKSKKFNLSVYVRWAASIALIAVLSFLVYLSNNHAKEDLFLAYYTAYPNVESPVSRSEANQQDVWLFYEQGNFAEASKLFNRNITKNKEDLTSWFYLGICELEQNKIREAENALKNVIAQKDSKYFEQATWYMALCYLKAQEKDKTKRELERIINTNSSYSAQAKELLKRLSE
jgi:Tfp pilus assembly protein PilF